MVFDHTGNLYVTEFLGNSVITKITPAGVSSQFADSSVGLNVPYGLAVDSAGNLYASN
jgi:DNA-binding beta-propeller fold protein YncE